MSGAESLEDTTFINTRNANIYHFAVGQTCVSVIRALPEKCPREFEGIPDECQAVKFESVKEGEIAKEEHAKAVKNESVECVTNHERSISGERGK